MAGSTNFLQWNPSQTNQESDAEYAADAQRVGGAFNDDPFPSKTANKVFFQSSTGVAALMQMMAAKGYNVNDTNLSTLASVLAAIQTSADIRSNLRVLSYSSSINCDVSQSLGFQINLSGNTTLTISGQVAGDKVAFIFVQDATGGRTVTFPSNFYGTQPDPTPNSISVVVFEISAANQGLLIAPCISTTGITGMAIGAANPSTGNFTILTANNPDQSDNTNKAATTFWAKYGFGITLAANGRISFPSWLGGLVIQWGQVNTDINGGTLPVSFPITFPNNAFVVIPVTNSSTDRITYVVHGTLSISGFTIGNNGSSGFAYWIAIGN